MATKATSLSIFDPTLLGPAVGQSFTKLDPRQLVRNPVIFVTEVVALVVTLMFVLDLFGNIGQAAFSGQIALWLWFTVLFATFAEAVAEGRGKAQADSLRKTKSDLVAKRLKDGARNDYEVVPAASLRVGNVVLVEAGDMIPGDGEVIEGVASVNESAITGESAPVIRESGGDRSAVTGGTTVLSDWIKVRISTMPGETFVDRMIALIEGAKRQKTPNEIALSILLSGLTLIFLIAVVTLSGFAAYSGTVVSVTVLAALLVTLIPTTIGGLLSAIGIAGMDRLIRFNVVATSGRAVEAAGDVDTLLLDKTGTITFGNRMATEFLPIPGVTEQALAEAALLASLADETPEGRSIVALAKTDFGLAEQDIIALGGTPIAFSADTRISGVDLKGRSIRKGAVDAILKFAGQTPQSAPQGFTAAVESIARTGGTPLGVAEGGKLLGVVHLKDVVKPGIKDRFATLRAMGIKTVMVTGDNPITAAAIASEAGVDTFLAEATPEQKLDYIRNEQKGGRLIAMCGDGTNDAPALAQADVGVAMQTGTQAAHEAGNMVDLDSSPTKLIEIVEIGKQILMTRGSLTTFSIANDVAKYFAIIPALFVATYPQLGALNVMGLASPQSAILSAIIFNALIIVALIPLALRGVPYRPVGAASLLRRNLLVYGLGGLIVPFIGIKLLDLVISALPSRLRLKMLQSIRPALAMMILFTILTGLIYPFAILGIGQAAFPATANGSLVSRDGVVVGSALIGQPFVDLRYFWPRPSAAGNGYDAANSSGSNLGPTSQKLMDRIGETIAKLRATGIEGPLPGDAATASGSGLDPDISPAYALLQATRVAEARSLPVEEVKDLVAANTEGPMLGFMGESRVNVLKLNLALDALAVAPGT